METVRVEDQGGKTFAYHRLWPWWKQCPYGLAELEVKNGKAIRLSTRTFCTTHEVALFLENLEIVSALGVDTPTCSSTGLGGWKLAVRWLRQKYPEVRNSVVTPNGLFGSMGLNGMAVLSARKRFDNLFISETHSKVLYCHRARHLSNEGEPKRNKAPPASTGIVLKIIEPYDGEWATYEESFVDVQILWVCRTGMVLS